MAHSSIGATFQSLPHEIRDEIYGHLFGKQCHIKLCHKGSYFDALHQADRSKEPGSKSTLKPQFGYHAGLPGCSPILRTCRQIYQEATPILYRRTVFSFPKVEDTVWNDTSGEPRLFPTECLQHVQNLTISVSHDDPMTSSRKAELIAFLIKESSAPRQLRLNFCIMERWVPSDAIDVETQDIVQNSRILETIKASRSLRKIGIILTDTRERDEPCFFAPFVHAIATTEDRSCEYKQVPLVEAREGVDDDGSIWKLDEHGHIWKWRLRSVPIKPPRDS